MSIATCNDICCTSASKLPVPAVRKRWFWSYMSLALPTLLYWVAKCPCQKSASFSWSGCGTVAIRSSHHWIRSCMRSQSPLSGSAKLAGGGSVGFGVKSSSASTIAGRSIGVKDAISALVPSKPARRSRWATSAAGVDRVGSSTVGPASDISTVDPATLERSSDLGRAHVVERAPLGFRQAGEQEGGGEQRRHTTDGDGHTEVADRVRQCAGEDETDGRARDAAHEPQRVRRPPHLGREELRVHGADRERARRAGDDRERRGDPDDRARAEEEDHGEEGADEHPDDRHRAPAAALGESTGEHDADDAGHTVGHPLEQRDARVGEMPVVAQVAVPELA